jgi:hypothetical protein
MNIQHIQPNQIKHAVERKAYAYGVSRSVCVLLGEYVMDLMQPKYGTTKEQLVSKPI